MPVITKVSDFDTPCQWAATSAGLVDFVVSAALSGYFTPAQMGVADGKTYEYVAMSQDGTVWEAGRTVSSASATTFSRAAIHKTSDGSAKVNFTLPPFVAMVGVNTSSLDMPFDSGTLMLFQQSTAPSGWVKQTTHNDKALRVVSGTASSGGTNSFSSMFTSRTSDGHTNSIGEMPNHAHTETATGFVADIGNVAGIAGSSTPFGTSTGAQGGSGAHTHTFDMRVQYVDLIIAKKS